MPRFDYPAGRHSFYGACKLTVVSGTVTAHGAVLRPGFTDSVYFPFHSLPWLFVATEDFSLDLEEIPESDFASTELQFYFTDRGIRGFDTVLPHFYHSEVGGADYPPDFLSRVSEIAAGPPVTIFCAGAANTGKSTFTRYLSNVLLSTHPKIFYVDLDPGQPEMSLPSLLSVTALDHYILSPPEHHTTSPDQQAFFAGGLTSGRLLFFEALLRVIDSLPPGHFVVVNSNGHTAHPGCLFQRDYIALLHPAHVFVLHSAGTPAELLDDAQVTVPIERQAPMHGLRDSRRGRTLRISTYFLRGGAPIVRQQPVELSLADVRIAVSVDEYFDRTQLPALLSASVVLLCIDSREYRAHQKKFALVTSVPPARAVGAALVRAVDVDRGVLWIVTPAPLEGVNLVLVTQALPMVMEFLPGSPRCKSTYTTFPAARSWGET